MRFVVDGMLGGLARWLRMLGHDVTYDSKSNDSELLSKAATDSRVLLTRDEELYRRAVAKNLQAILVTGKKEEERLAQVASSFHISLRMEMSQTKCPECGTDVEPVLKKDVLDQVPTTSLKLYNEFWRCENPTCQKIYWKGSHWNRIQQTLIESEKLVGKDT
jgi:uncharacterized protein with PIN domain